MTGYRRILHKEKQGSTARNRLGKDTALSRRVRKLCGKSTWFQKKGDPKPSEQGPRRPAPRTTKQEKVCETAIFIPITENSNLKKRLQEEERKMTGFGTVKYVERGAQQ